MPDYVLRNDNFRDEVLQYAYPFDDRSRLEGEHVVFGSDLVIDAVVYSKEAAELPFFISEVDGTAGDPNEALLTISDSAGDAVATTLVGKQEVSYLTTAAGVSAGLLVFNVISLRRFVGRVTGNRVSLLPDVATFSLDVSHVSTTPHFRYLVADDKALSGVVKVVARHKVWFGTNKLGQVTINVSGDSPTGATGALVRSINGVANQSIWLAGHPRGNLRISTADGNIKFVRAEDAT